MYQTQVFCARGETIASLAWYPKPTVNGVTETYREGNARLMAAAPDLLGIAELVNAACPDDVEAGDGAVLVALSVEEVLTLRKAIDKAKEPPSTPSPAPKE